MPGSAQMPSAPWCYELLPHQNVENKRELAFSLWPGCSIFVANSLLTVCVRQSMTEEHEMEQRSYPLEAFSFLWSPISKLSSEVTSYFLWILRQGFDSQPTVYCKLVTWSLNCVCVCVCTRSVLGMDPKASLFMPSRFCTTELNPQHESRLCDKREGEIFT